MARHQPAGPVMVDHFHAPDDRRTHIERLNPLDATFATAAAAPDAASVRRPLPLRGYNGTGAIIAAQHAAPAPAPAPEPVAEPVPEPVAEPEGELPGWVG